MDRKKKFAFAVAFGITGIALCIAYMGGMAVASKDITYFWIGTPIILLGAFAIYKILSNYAKTLR
jgi:hypothetical protein